jgi:hypothetical protein
MIEEGGEVGYKTLMRAARDAKAPWAVRVQAARALVGLAGHVEATATEAVRAATVGAVALADMTESQLLAHLASLQAALATAQAARLLEAETEDMPAIPPGAADPVSLL